jgi:hypothetical protein
MGNFGSITKINFEDLQYALQTNYLQQYIIISTCPTTNTCLIKGTLTPEQEEFVINDILQKKQTHAANIIVYGLNDCDETVIQKYKQLHKFGFSNVFVYLGGMFEWSLLQDIYGENNFPTTQKQLDILKFKPQGRLQLKLLTAR